MERGEFMKRSLMQRSVVLLAIALTLFAVACNKKNIKNPRVGAAQPGAPAQTKPEDLTKPNDLNITPAPTPPATTDNSKNNPNRTDEGRVDSNDDDNSRASQRPTRSEATELDKVWRESTLPDADSGYTQEKLEADGDRKSTYALALLEKEEDTLTELKLSCYDGSDSIGASEEGEIRLFPQYQALIEVFNHGEDLEALKTEHEEAEEGKRDKTPEYLLTSCKGNTENKRVQTSFFMRDESKYRVVRLTDGEEKSDYLKDDSSEKDRSKVNTTISCRNELVDKKDMEPKKADDSDVIINRITLTKNSRILFAQPINYRLKKSEKTLKEENPELRDFVLYICQ